ncbi:MAG: hypothetical protein KatS3mg043_0502 [Rhodothermaceae bacterium]|nr:MAG: hypothetical protein KatS3mg043_0502 [Rhodothermaceae bacterium]
MELERLRRMTFDEVRRDRMRIWALRYGLLESIQIVINLACALVSRHNLGYPKSYADCLRLLVEHGYLDPERGGHLIRAVGPRNLLVHEYLDVDDALVFAALERLDDLAAFAGVMMTVNDGPMKP